VNQSTNPPTRDESSQVTKVTKVLIYKKVSQIELVLF